MTGRRGPGDEGAAQQEQQQQLAAAHSARTWRRKHGRPPQEWLPAAAAHPHPMPGCAYLMLSLLPLWPHAAGLHGLWASCTNACPPQARPFNGAALASHSSCRMLHAATSLVLQQLAGGRQAGGSELALLAQQAFRLRPSSAPGTLVAAAVLSHNARGADRDQGRRVGETHPCTRRGTPPASAQTSLVHKRRATLQDQHDLHIPGSTLEPALAHCSMRHGRAPGAAANPAASPQLPAQPHPTHVPAPWIGGHSRSP
jgi:hypothetical protein